MMNLHVSFQDQRKYRPSEISLDPAKLQEAAKLVDLTGDVELRIRLRDAKDTHTLGYAAAVGAGSYRIVIYVRTAVSYSDRASYVVNNTLLHELRHVHQAGMLEKVRTADGVAREALMAVVREEMKNAEKDAEALGRMAANLRPLHLLSLDEEWESLAASLGGGK